MANEQSKINEMEKILDGIQDSHADWITNLGNGVFKVSADGITVLTTEQGVDQINQAILDEVRKQEIEIQPHHHHMTRQEYFSLREMIGISDGISKMITNLAEILEKYPHLRDRTGNEIKEFLFDRGVYFENLLRERLNVE